MRYRRSTSFLAGNYPGSFGRWILLSILGSLLAGLSLTAAEDYSSRLWQMEEGLPHNIVQAIAQGTNGYLWVGTREGLARFDGAQFEPVQLTSEVRHPSILCLLSSRDGTLWVGTEAAGLFRLQGSSIQRVPAPDGAVNYNVYELHEGRDSVWLACSLGVMKCVNGSLEKRADFRNAIESICVDGTGAVWQVTSGKLRRLDPLPTTNYEVRVGVLPPDARKLYWDPAGAFWMASGNGVTCLKEGVATAYWKAAGPAGFVRAFLRDRRGQLWMGAYAGLSRFADGTFINDYGPDDPSYATYSVIEDAEGTIWVGSEEGLTRLSPKVFKTYTKRDGLTLNSVVTVCASRDGSTWVGVWGGGLNRIVDGKIQVFGKSEGLSSEFVMAMTEGHDGSLWVGTDYSHPLNRVKDGQVTQYGPEQGLAVTAHTALLEDNELRLWIGTRDGLQCFEDGRFHLYSKRDGLSHDKINALCLSRDGSVWIGTAGGLTRRTASGFEDLSARIPALKTVVLCLHENAEGWLWIGTQGEGLFCLRGSQVNKFSTRTGLLSDSIYSIQEDDQGYLWLNSSRGIFRVSKAELAMVMGGRREGFTSVGYGKADGVLSRGQYREVTQPAACKSTDGRIWFRTTQGVAVVDPAQLVVNRRPPPVAIEAVIGDQVKVWERTGLTGPGPLVVPKGRGELEIHYTALSLRAPERNRFRYRLEGVDANWIEAGERRSAYYNKVPPGEYRFQVTACNNDGLWNEVGTTVFLRLEPHFWQTRWFLATCVLLCIGGIVAVAAWVTRSRMKRELRRLEQQHAVERERARIARDMHDELGAKLARISFQGATAKRMLGNPSEAGPQVEKMAQTARELVSSLDEIVWAVDPENDSLEHLANYICGHASEFFNESPVACEFEIPAALPSCRLGSDARHHLFLAAKEAFTNVMKHSQASRLRVTFLVRDGEFEILIADNGCGLSEAPGHGNEAKPRRPGHGLGNMRERLAAIGGRAEISTTSQGTSVRFVIPCDTFGGAAMSSIHPTAQATRF